MQIKKKSKKILALDQALQQSGWALFNSDGVLQKTGIITPNKGETGYDRYPTVRNKFYSLINEIAPDIIVLEPPYGDDVRDEKGRKTFQVLSYIYGMVHEIAASLGIEVIEVPAATWQNACSIFSRDRTTRKNGARKFSIEKFNLPDTLAQDEYDACCIGYTYFYKQTFQPGTVSWEKPKETLADRERVSAF